MATKLIKVVEVPPDVVEAAHLVKTFAAMYERNDEWSVEGLMPVSWATRELRESEAETQKLNTEITLLAHQVEQLREALAACEKRAAIAEAKVQLGDALLNKARGLPPDVLSIKARGRAADWENARTYKDGDTVMFNGEPVVIGVDTGAGDDQTSIVTTTGKDESK